MKRIWTLLLCIMIMFSLAAFTGCGQESDESTEDTALEYTIDKQAVTLTIMSAGKEDVVYTAEDLQQMGLTENTYSGRSKKVQNARQFATYSGVDVNTLLQNAGYDTENIVIKVICSDGYTREYDVADDLYGKYTFSDNETDNKTEVIPMIAVVQADESSEYPAPFKLVYGQEDYDTNDSQDFNMQGWASYIQCIQVSYDD